MSEGEFQSKYNIWKKYNMPITCAEELKICKINRFNLKKIEPHQLSNLYNTKHGFCQFKIPDLGSQNPYDSYSMFKEPAFVVILWYYPRKPKEFYVIDIDKIINLKVKSLTQQEAKDLADVVGVLK